MHRHPHPEQANFQPTTHTAPARDDRNTTAMAATSEDATTRAIARCPKHAPSMLPRSTAKTTRPCILFLARAHIWVEGGVVGLPSSSAVDRGEVDKMRMHGALSYVPQTPSAPQERSERVPGGGVTTTTCQGLTRDPFLVWALCVTMRGRKPP